MLSRCGVRVGRNMKQHELEIASGKRFTFGDNWKLFLDCLDSDRILLAEQSLRTMLGVENLSGKSFLDIGSGSGLFSLAARRLGATVHSFDYDPQSVNCTAELRRRYFPNDHSWVVEEGSALDKEYLSRLGCFDVVYSWGVLHHTGNLEQAMGGAALAVKMGGQLFIAIYNDQGSTSKTWLRVKRTYNALPAALRWLVLFPAFLRLWGPTTLRDFFQGRPFHTWRSYARRGARGMNPWRDVVDWVGGLPFEVATPEKIFQFYYNQGFQLTKLKTCGGGLGCNEFVFVRSTQAISDFPRGQ